MMIKKMRIKFIAITTAALLLLLLAIFLLINIYMNYRSNEQVDRFLFNMIMNDGFIMENTIPPYAPENNRAFQGGPHLPIKGFSVKLDTNGEVISVFCDEIFLSIDDAVAYAETVYQSDNDMGKTDSYKYMRAQTYYGVLIVFADQGMQDHMLLELLNLSYITGSVSFVVLLIITIFLSKLIVQPIHIAFEKQREFVTDSGHELKTPLSIISANTDILEMEYGTNKHVDEIKNQVHRMTALTKELLSLAKTETLNRSEDFTEFDLSYLIENTVLPFESLAFETGKEIILNVEEGIRFKGDENHIKKMLTELTDNAVKYAVPDSKIEISLHKKGKKRIICVKNRYLGELPKEKSKLFDRFYRGDKSRTNRINGYGIGLSIVRNIVESHGGRIYIDSVPNDTIVFRVVF